MAAQGREDYRPGDIVRLSRIKVQKYNNATGKIVEYNVDDAGVGRYVIQMQQSGELVAVRAHNLTKVSQNGRQGGDGKSGTKPGQQAFEKGDYIEISGLKLRSTSQFNGQTGYIVEYIQDKRGVGRYTVIVEGSKELVALRARYLRKMQEKYGKGGKGFLGREDNDGEDDDDSFTLWKVLCSEGVSVHADADTSSAKVGLIPAGMIVQAIGQAKSVGSTGAKLIPVFDGWVPCSDGKSDLLVELPELSVLNAWQKWV